MNEEQTKQSWIPAIALGLFYVLFHFIVYVNLSEFDPIFEFGSILGSLAWPTMISNIISSDSFKESKLRGLFKANIFKFDLKSPFWWRNIFLLGFLFNLLNLFIVE